MNLKIGDRVIFLNEKGGGVVTKIVSNDIVHVSVEDGFEIPYAVTDLLKSGTNDPFADASAVESRETENPGMKDLFFIPNKKDQRKEGVYLALTPADQDHLTKGSLDVQLINHSQYQLLFSIFLNRSGIYHGLDFGYADAESSLLITTIDRTEIEDWSNGMVQLVFFREGKADPLMPASQDIAFRPVKVYKDESFQFEGLLRKKSLFIDIALIDNQARNLRKEEVSEENVKLLQEKMREGTRKAEKPAQKEGFLDKHKVDDRIAEVDLHIGELADNFGLMSNAEMLTIQMDYMKKCMEQAMTEKLKKIIFIHGVGNGTLKNELLRFFRQTPDIDFYDAPYARYGMGATEVLFYKHL